MTTIKNNQILKEQNNSENNYKLNMEILSSLKSIPGKVLNLQSEKYIFKNEETNKKGIFPEEKFTTSSSISKELFCDSFNNDIDKIPKKSYTTNSVFKPISFPIKKSTLNFYGIGSMMSLSDFLLPNPNPFNPLKITNSSYSKNSFYPFINPDTTLINPPINPINQINQVNSINPFLYPNFSQIPIINEQLLKKNNVTQTKNNFLLNKKRNSENEINFIFQDKENKQKEYNDIEKTILNKNNKTKGTIFYVNQQLQKENKENQKKNLFTVIAKSNYVYRKRKPRKKKLYNIKNKIYCGHNGCEGVFKTKKQLVFHHYKMSPECHNDTISLLKMIYLIKKILLKNIKEKEKNNIFEKYSILYKETMKNISLDEHIETLVGFNFEDEIPDKK